MAYSHSAMHILSILFALSAILQPCEALSRLGPGMQVRLRPSNYQPWWALRHDGSQIWVNEPPEVIDRFASLGCVVDNENRAFEFPISSQDMDIELCAAHCDGYEYFGTQFGIECWCGNDIDTNEYPILTLEDGGCTSVCAGDNTQNCGGFFRMNVFIHTDFSKLGCVVDNQERALDPIPGVSPYASSSMTWELCSDHCEDYKYFGIQNGVECWCGSNIDFNAYPANIPASECNFDCPGNSLQKCGAGWRMQLFENYHNAQFNADSTWVVIPGLSGYGVSLRSENRPNHFLRHSDWYCYLSQFENTDNFKGDASWNVDLPLVNGSESENRVSLRSVNFPDLFMRHEGLWVRVNGEEYTEPFLGDATWVVETLEAPNLSGNWRLLWSYDNTNSSNDFSKTWTTTVGITETDSVTGGSSWLVSITASASYSYFGFSASISGTYEQQQFIESTSESEYSVTTTEESAITVQAGTAAYMWQWSMTAGNPNTFSLTNSFGNYKLTDSSEAPTGPP